MQQLDIIHHSPAALARACRIAADTERHNAGIHRAAEGRPVE